MWIFNLKFFLTKLWTKNICLSLILERSFLLFSGPDPIKKFVSGSALVPVRYNILIKKNSDCLSVFNLKCKNKFLKNK